VTLLYTIYSYPIERFRVVERGDERGIQGREGEREGLPFYN
jgi:hypothetical protein